jgi:hypothetical protein
VFSSYFISANFVVIPAWYTRAPTTPTDKSEHDEERATGKMRKESDHVTHPRGPATAWRCSHAAAFPPQRPPRVGL